MPRALLEVSGHAEQPLVGLELWLQVRNVAREHERLARAGVTVTRPPRQEPWGLVEMWVEDPDGVQIAVVEVPDDPPLRRDMRRSDSRSTPTVFDDPEHCFPGLLD